MNYKIFLAGLLALLLAACKPAVESTEVNSMAETRTDTTAHVLGSGIDQSGFDTTVRPQDDFFQYANGAWLEGTEIPADKPRWGPFMILAQKSQDDIRLLVEEISALQNVKAGSAAQKIRDYYNSYLDSAKASELGLEAIRIDLDKISAAENLQDITRLFGELTIYGVTTPLAPFIFSDFKDANTNVVYISENGLTLPDRDYYLLDDERYVKGRELYRAYAAALFSYAGREDGKEIAEKLLALETKLARAYWTREDNRDRVKQYNPYTADELATLAPAIQWPVFFAASNLPARDVYIVWQPSYLEAASGIFATTDVETWKQYLIFQLISNYAPVLGDDFFTAWFTMFQNGLQGVEEPQPLWKRAVTSLSNNMGELLGQLYIEKLAAQYNNYEVIDGLTINGEFTSGENIGDFGGLTGDQRFFLGWAQVWRAKSRPEETRRLLTIDPHSPPKYRANGAAVNVPAFYKAFDVKEGDGMYLPPEDRVKIW